MPILCYHTVEPGWTSSLSVEPQAFDAQCRWMSAHRRVVPLDHAVAALDHSQRLPRGVVALTFDDGLTGVRDHALPALLRHGLPATVFVVTDTLVNPGRPVDWVDEAPPVPLRALSVDDVRAMAAEGVQFGSHSSVHADLVQLNPEECERDLRASREVLEDVVGGRVRYLAYPRGRHDERVRSAAARAGFERAFGLPQGPEPLGRYAVPRVGVFGGNTLAHLRVKSSRWYPGARRSTAYATARRVAAKRHVHERSPS